MRQALALLAAAWAAAAPAADAHLAAPAPARAGAHALRPAPARSPGAGASYGGVTGSKHDLSVTGPGPVKAVSETRVCIFCHVSHHGAAGGANRAIDQAPSYRAYASSTLSSPPAGAARASRVCLSCHDGTIAVGRTLASGKIAMRSGDGPLAAGSRSVLGTDLRRSHPIAVRPTQRRNLRQPLAGDPVQLDHSGTVECTSCHDPHREDRDPTLRKFLVKPGAQSALCSSCHAMEGWSTNPSAHQSSTRPVEPVPSASPYRSIAEAGCATCHDAHDGSERGWLLKDGADVAGDGLCLRCHDGQVARLNVAADVRKPFAHATPGAADVHDAGEGPTVAAHRLPEAAAGARRHVACVDCHDPHAAYALPARPPVVGGALAGVSGIDRNGLAAPAVRFEYEVCFKCHGDSANQPQARGPSLPDTLRRATTDVNLRRVFDASAA